MQGKGLYPRARDQHNVRGFSLLFREDAAPLPVTVDDLMLVTHPSMMRMFEGQHLTRSQLGGAVEEMKRGWRKWNRHINAVVSTTYDEDADVSVVTLGILYPNRFRRILKKYAVLDYETDVVYEPQVDEEL